MPSRFTAARTSSAVMFKAAPISIGVDHQPAHKPSDPLQVLPYPGGRHPRIGFRDGMIRPQRETKVSVFAPWAGGGYAVADTPEAVWFEPTPKQPELLYLAHTHVPTIWDKKRLILDPVEWTQHQDGSLTLQRTLPNKVTLTSKVMPGKDGVRMEFKVANDSAERLTGMRVQMCVMLAGLAGFEKLTNENKVFATPFAACRNEAGKRWIITGWESCGRAWGNPLCPCLHADPLVADCPAGEERSVRGWLSFYEGDAIDAELKRLAAIAFN